MPRQEHRLVWGHAPPNVSGLVQRRGLALLFSDAIEPASLQALAGPLKLICSRHLLVYVVFRDPTIDAAMAASTKGQDGFYRAGAAAELAVERERGLAVLRRTGAIVIESRPGDLSTTVVNTYLRVKGEHLL